MTMSHKRHDYRRLLMYVRPICVLLFLRLTPGFADEGHEPELPSWAAGQRLSPLYWLEWPKDLRGSVRDENGRPIPRAKVTLNVTVQLLVVGGQYEKSVFRNETVTDEAGNYAFDTSDFPTIRHRPVVTTVTATAPDRVPWQAWWWYGPLSMVGEPRFGRIKLAVGRVVSGRVVGRDGQPVPDAVLLGQYAGSARGRWALGRTKTDKLGRFQIRVPEGDGVGVWISASHAAPKFAAIPTNQKPDLEIALEPGVELEGRVLSKQNQPAVGVVVVAESTFGGTFRTHYLPFRVAVRTDQDGRYRLPPLTGEYRVFVTEASTSMDESTTYESKSPIPIVLPQVETIGPTGKREIDFRGSDPVTIEGTVTWDDSKPVVGSTVTATRMPAGNGAGLKIAESFTDDEGHYRLVVPASVERLLVNVGPRKRHNKTVRAYSGGIEYPQIEKVTDKSHTISFTYGP